MRLTQRLEELRDDVKVAIRQLRSAPTFAGAAVLALALGIGAATTIFSIIQNVLLDPYPMYKDVDRIVGVVIHDDSIARPGGRDSYQIPEFLDYQARATSFEEVIAGGGEPAIVSTAEGSEQFVGGLVSGNTFSFMGVSAVVGRSLTMDDAKPDAAPVFVMSHKTWANRFGMDPTIVGRTFVWNGVPRTLVGIMPPRVSKLGADLWRPVPLDPSDTALADRYFKFQARLKPGVTIEQARAEMAVLAPQIAKKYPRNYPPKFSVEVPGLIDSIVGPFRRTLYTMAAAVALLLLIACGNVANMLLSRAAGREREMALRGALGATRLRLVRQLLVESLMLAAFGVTAGCLVAQAGITLVVRAIPEGLIPRESLIRLDTRVLIFSLVIAAITAVIFGLAPALQSAKADLIEPLRDSGKGTSGGFRRRGLSSALVVGEIALSLVLLTCAGLLMRSFIRMQSTDLGLNPNNILLVTAAVGIGNTASPEDQQQFLAQALERVRTLPGVVAAATTNGFPTFGGQGIDFDVSGIPHDSLWRGEVELCDDTYLRTLGMPILQGRDLEPADIIGKHPVAVVNRRLVEQHLNGLDPIGRVVTFAVRNTQGKPERHDYQIVGVVRDAKNNGIFDPIAPQVFVPYTAVPTRGRAILVKTAGAPLALTSAVKHELWAVNRGVAIIDAGALGDYLQQYAYSEPRLGLFIFGAFAVIGLVLVILGVYSLVAYTVSRQTREIGIRIAIGASGRDVLWVTMGMGLRWIASGIGAGLLASFAATRVLANQLWETSATDPLTIAFVVAVIAASGLAAAYIPARRAMRVDPMVVLRYE